MSKDRSCADIIPWIVMLKKSRYALTAVRVETTSSKRDLDISFLLIEEGLFLKLEKLVVPLRKSFTV